MAPDPHVSALGPRLRREGLRLRPGSGESHVQGEDRAMVYSAADSRHPVYNAVAALHQPAWASRARSAHVIERCVLAGLRDEIGRASCRERVEISVVAV